MQIKFLKTKKSFKKGGIHINPNIYWGACLSVFFVVVVSSFIYGFYLFRKINKELVTTTNNNNIQTQTADKERIEKVLDYFSEREQKSIQILNSSAPVVDPSL